LFVRKSEGPQKSFACGTFRFLWVTSRQASPETLTAEKNFCWLTA